MAETFDTVIVGAGTAGCVLADRLSLDNGRRVLLLEAGRWDWNPLIHIPYGARKMFDHSMFQWGDISDPDPTLDDHRQSVPHGKVIGGTGSLNFMGLMIGAKFSVMSIGPDHTVSSETPLSCGKRRCISL